MTILPTGNQVRAARSLLGWEQKELAAKAGLHPGTVNRMEKCGNKAAGRVVRNIEKVQTALEKGGVEITDDGVRFTKSRKK